MFPIISEDMELYLCIAQVALEESSRKVFYMYMHMHKSLMHDTMAFTYLL